MGIADILDESAELIKTNFALLVGIAAVVYVPYTILEEFLQRGIYPDPQSPHQAIGSLGLSGAFGLVLGSIVTAALTFAISERYLGRETSIVSCFRRVLQPGLFARFMVASVLKTMLVAFGLIIAILIGLGAVASVSTTGSQEDLVASAVIMGFMVLLGTPWMIYSLLRFAVMEPALIVESRGVFSALGRSWGLMSGSMGKALGLYVIVGLALAIIMGVVTAPTQIAIETRMRTGTPVPAFLFVLNVALLVLVRTLTTPILSMVAILLYYDIRIRKEGFDLELLAAELDAGPKAGFWRPPPREEDHV